MPSTPDGFLPLRRRFAGCWIPAGTLSGRLPSAGSFWPGAVRRRWAGSQASSIVAIMSPTANRWAFGDSSNARTIRRQPRPSFPPWRRGLAGRAWPSSEGRSTPPPITRSGCSSRALMMTYTPPYYSRLVESCGFAKEKDLFAFLIDGDYRLPEWMDSLAGRIARRKGIHIRPFRPEEEDAEFARIKEIYNDSWSANWGFVPLSDGEMR